MEINRILSGVSILSCQSGKDRTSMALTLEEGRILKETCGISNQQVMEIMAVRKIFSILPNYDQKFFNNFYTIG